MKDFLMGAQAVPIAGTGGRYLVSDTGEVISSPTQRHGFHKMRQDASRAGYLRVLLTLPGHGSKWHTRRMCVRVHVLVAEAFLGRRPKGYQTRHLNGIKTDNRASNLAWGTAKDNADDRTNHGQTLRGEHHGSSKLTDTAVRDIRRRAGQESQEHIAAQYGVAQTTVSRIQLRRTWAHVN